MGPQRAIGKHHGGPGGPLGFSGLGKIPVKPSPGRVWGEIGPPKRFLGTIETIPLAKNLGKPRGGPIPPQSYVFRAPFFGPKRAPGPSGPQTLTWGSKNGVRGQKYQSCVLKNHAEPTGRCPKWGHMLQVMAPNHTSWPRKAQGLFWGPKRGSEKHNFVEGSVLHEVSQDFLRGEWFLWYPGTLWVYQFPPKPFQGRVLQGFSPNPKTQGGPLGPWVGSLFALCGPYSPID